MTDLDVMVLCAGLGTRLRPLTLECAKPAVPLLNRPLVGYSLALARTLGIGEVTINTHWLPETMSAAADAQARELGLRLHVSHEPELLGTGGGLWQARQRRLLRRDHDVLVLNGDVLFDVDLDRAVKAHRDSGAAATMVLRPMPPGATYSPIHAASDGRVFRIGRHGAPDASPAWLFTGVHVLSPDALDLLPPGESSVVEKVYAPLLSAGGRVQAVFEEGLWLDLGDPAGYLSAHLKLLSGVGPLGVLERNGILRRPAQGISSDARVASSALVRLSAVGPGAVIGEDARVTDSVIWPGAVVGAGEHVDHTVVTTRTRVPVAPLSR